jgi:FkbM family methyltransferase
MDRPGLRRILAWLATGYAKQKTGLDVRIIHADGAWVRKTGNYRLAESQTFDWTAPKIAGWKEDLGDLLDMYRDWWFYQYKPKHGDVIVDIGAGIGDDALIFSKAVGLKGKVLSVEAHPATFQLLQTNCLHNHLQNTSYVHGALMDKTGTVTIDSRANYKANTISRAVKDASSVYQVPACSFDELCARHGIEHIDFLKMNIEGAERLAIQGMPRMIQHISQLCIASHDFISENNEFYRTKNLVIDFLKSHGFQVTVRDQHPDPWVRDHVYGTRK